MKIISKYDFDQKVAEVYGNTKVQIRLGDLEQVMRAAQKCLRFAIMHDTFLGGGLAVKEAEMAAAYKNINEQLAAIRKKAASKAEKIVEKKFEVK